MKNIATIFMVLIFSSVGLAKEIFEGPPAKTWDPVRVTALAKELYRQAWQTSAIVQSGL